MELISLVVVKRHHRGLSHADESGYFHTSCHQALFLKTACVRAGSIAFRTTIRTFTWRT